MCGVNRCPRHAASWGEVDESGAGVQPSGGNAGDGRGRSGSPPVSRVLLCANAPATIHLGDVLPRRSSSLPGSDASRVMASLFGLAPDGVLHAVHVAAHAVGSYPALPPARRRTISTLPVPCGHRRYVFCSTFRRLGPRFHAACCARPLAGILLCGARTFLRACAPRLPGGLPARILPHRSLQSRAIRRSPLPSPRCAARRTRRRPPPR